MPASTGAIVAVAAHARTSHGLTTTTRSAVSKRDFSGVGQPARKIADHGRPAAAAGVDDGVARRRRPMS